MTVSGLSHWVADSWVYDHGVASHRRIQLSFTVTELGSADDVARKNRHPWFVEKQKASCTVRR